LRATRGACRRCETAAARPAPAGSEALSAAVQPGGEPPGEAQGPGREADGGTCGHGAQRPLVEWVVIFNQL